MAVHNSGLGCAGIHTLIETAELYELKPQNFMNGDNGDRSDRLVIDRSDAYDGCAAFAAIVE